MGAADGCEILLLAAYNLLVVVLVATCITLYMCISAHHVMMNAVHSETLPRYTVYVWYVAHCEMVLTRAVAPNKCLVLFVILSPPHVPELNCRVIAALLRVAYSCSCVKCNSD
jgi:hypothetical protein